MLWQQFLWNTQTKNGKGPWIVSKSGWDVQKWIALACLGPLWALVPWSRCSVPCHCHVSNDCCQFASTSSLVGSLSFFPFWKQLSTQNVLWGYTSQETSRQLVFGGSIIQAGFILVRFKVECVHESPGDSIKAQILILGWDLRFYSSSMLPGLPGVGF